MKTRHTTTAPYGVPSREIKLAKVIVVPAGAPLADGGFQPVKKVLEFSRAFRSRMNSKMFRKARKANTEFLPVPCT